MIDTNYQEIPNLSIEKLNDLANICHNALVEVRMDSNWNLLSDVTKEVVIQTMRIIKNKY